MKTILYIGDNPSGTVVDPFTNHGTDYVRNVSFQVGDKFAVKLCADHKDFTIQETKTANSGATKGK